MKSSVKEGEWRETECALRSRIHARERIRKRKRIKMPFSEGQWSSASPCLALAVLLTGGSKQNSDKLKGLTSKKHLWEKRKGNLVEGRGEEWG